MDNWETFLRGNAFAQQMEEQLTEGLARQAQHQAWEQMIYSKTGLVVSLSEDGSQVRSGGVWLATEEFLKGLE